MTFQAKKTVKLQGNQKLPERLQAMRSFDQKIESFLDKKKKFQFKAQELGLTLGYFLSDLKKEKDPREEELQNIFLQKILKFAEELNFDPDHPDDYGTFMLFTLLFQSIFQISRNYVSLKEENESIKEELKKYLSENKLPENSNV